MLLSLLINCDATAQTRGVLPLHRLAPEAVDLVRVRPSTAQWYPLETTREGNVYTAELPFHEISLRTSNQTPPAGMRLLHSLRQRTTYAASGPWTWYVEGRTLRFEVPPDTPADPRLRVRYPRAASMERRRTPELQTEAIPFVQRRIRTGPDSMYGVFLPTPARAQWFVQLPEDARFRAWVHRIPAAVTRSATSDGQAEVTVTVGGSKVISASCAPALDAPCELDLNLGAHAGSDATVELKTRATGAQQDLFFESPAIYSAQTSPRRIVFLFADTFRADRLGVFGAHRKTPNLDAWAGDAARFSQARSVSSWTLPSIRAVRSSRQPEHWSDVPSLAEHLRAHGFQTTGLVNNVFTSEHEDIGRGFQRYRYEFVASAEVQVREAIAALDRNPDRDLLLSVQFMDTHLPYTEPEPFRSMYTQGRLAGQRRLDLAALKQPAQRSVVRDRYDQNVQYLDHALGPLFERLNPNDVVVFFSDHGEEFWEHGGFEHGHALWEEVVRVPLVIAGPNLPAQTFDTPVSLLDIAPTVLDLVDLPPLPGATGTSLKPLMRGEKRADSTLRRRDQLIGRTLWDADAWALLQNQRKTVSHFGQFVQFDLAKDPTEQAPLNTRAAKRAEAAEAMGALAKQDFVEVFAIKATNRHLQVEDGTLKIELDQPIAAAWRGARTAKVDPIITANTVTVEHPTSLPGNLYVLPQGGLGAVGSIRVELITGGRTWSGSWRRGTEPFVLKLGEGPAELELRGHLVPMPGDAEIPSTVTGLEAQLEALGYAE